MFFRENRKGKMVDMHCHVLPAVDDGSQSMEETMKMLRIAASEGIQAMIVTPHFKEGRHNAGVRTIYERIQMVMDEAKRYDNPVLLYPGNEIFYFEGLEEGLERGEILSLNNTDRVLIEFSPAADYIYMRNALDGVRASGYIPILAHAERYECMVRDWSRAKELKQLDAEIQINASSAAGRHGGTIRKFTYILLQNKLVDYVGTDAHNAKNRAPQFQNCYRTLKKKFGEVYINEIFYENALAILNAE